MLALQVQFFERPVRMPSKTLLLYELKSLVNPRSLYRNWRTLRPLRDGPTASVTLQVGATRVCVNAEPRVQPEIVWGAIQVVAAGGSSPAITCVEVAGNTPPILPAAISSS